MESELALRQLLLAAKALDLVVQPQQAPFDETHDARLPNSPRVMHCHGYLDLRIASIRSHLPIFERPGMFLSLAIS